MNTELLNIEKLRQATLNTSPYPYLRVDNFIAEHALEGINRDFPKIRDGGSFPLQELACGQHFNALCHALQSDELKQVFADKFSLELTDKPAMLTVRGQSRAKDGRIHTDTKSKLLTVLLYLNPTWEHEGGCLRILNNGNDIQDYVEEVPPVFGTLLAFKVTRDCWHGHTAHVGERRSMQLNYVTDKAAVDKQIARHGLSAKLKSLFAWFKH